MLARLCRPRTPAQCVCSTRAQPSIKRCATARAASTEPSTSDYSSLYTWLIESKGLPRQAVTVESVGDGRMDAVGCVASQDIKAGEVAFELPQDIAITAVDVAKHPLVADLAEGRGELTGLALWLMAERANPDSSWAPYLSTLPSRSLSPILWDDAFRKVELMGSPVLDDARARESELRAQWKTIAEVMSAGDSAARFPSSVFNEQAFVEAFTVVLAHTAYLPTAQCFAMLPMISFARRTGNGDGCDLDYDTERESVVVRATKGFAKGDEVRINDGRPSGEVLLVTGQIQPKNESNYLTYDVSLVAGDRMYTTKREVVSTMNMTETETFPLYEDRFPIQLLSYLRFSRIQDAALLAKVRLDEDVIVTVENEYEVLQLFMADVRDRLQNYIDGSEEDIKLLQGQLPDIERLAVQVRLQEKRILLATTDAIRTRLAPIRGVPTKSGKMVDPNADLIEIFETFENLPNAPKKIWGDFRRWARGDDDPTFR